MSGGEFCAVVRADTNDLFAFAERGQRYVSSLESIFDSVSSTRAGVVAAMGSADAPAAGAAIRGGGNDPMAELIAEAGLANAFVSEIAEALSALSATDGVSLVPADVVDAALADVGLAEIGADRSAEDDQRILEVWAARREIQDVVDEAGSGVPDHLRERAVGMALDEWLDDVDTSDPDQVLVVAEALLAEGIELRAGLEGDGSGGSADGGDGAVAALLVTTGLLWWPGDHGDLVDDLAGRQVSTPLGERSALQVMVDALDLDQTNDNINWYGFAMTETERTTQPWVRNNLLLTLIDGTIASDGTISAGGQTLVDDVLDRYPELIELSEQTWHSIEAEDWYHRTVDGVERDWPTEGVVAVLGEALAAPNYGLSEDQYEAAVSLDELDKQLIDATSESVFNELLAERFALVEQLAGGGPDLALLIDGAMARGLPAAEALRLAQFGANAEGPDGTDARVRRLRLVYPTTAWGDPIDPANASNELGFSDDVGLSLAIELAALQQIQAVRFAEGMPEPEIPLTAEEIELVRQWSEVAPWFHHRFAWGYPGGTEEAARYIDGLSEADRDRILFNAPDGFYELLAQMNQSDQVWDLLLGAADNDTFLGPDGTFRPPGGNQHGTSGDAQALLAQLAVLSTIGPHHERFDTNGDGIIHEDEVARWLEENDGLIGVPPALVDQVRVGATVGLGQDTFGWEEFGEIVGWVGIAAAATVTIVYSGGAAAPLWVKGGLVGLAALETYAWYQAGDNLSAALAGTAIIGDVVAATRLIRLARNVPAGSPTRGLDVLQHREALLDIARQSDNPALRELAATGSGMSDAAFLDRFEAILSTEAAGIIRQQVANGATPAEAIAPFREAGLGDGIIIFRGDDFPFSPQGSAPGRLKSHIDPQTGDLIPANADGNAAIHHHVRGSEPAKSQSPFTSFTSDGAIADGFGEYTIHLDLTRLEADIAAGRVEGVKIISPEEVQQHLADRVNTAQVRFDANPSIKNEERLESATADLANAKRDTEFLIEGIVPSEYLTVVR